MRFGPRASSTKSRFRWLGRLVLAATAASLALVAAEILLVRRALPLAEPVARYVHGCYEPTQPRRCIFASIRPLKLRLHRPDFESDCYFLGYSWRHRSDGHGWRNPETRSSADVVVLGDSIVYGHGVEERETTTHFLRGLLDRPVVNMGITGGSPVHYLAFLRNFALPLRPRVIVVLFFGNDLDDIKSNRSPDRIERFVRSGEGREMRILPRATLLERLRLLGGREPTWLDRLAVYRLVDYRVQAWRASRSGSRPESRRRPWIGAPRDPADLAPPGDEVLDRMEGRITVAYLRRALKVMAESSRSANAELVVGHIGRRTRDDWFLRRLLRESSTARGMHYFETPVLEGRYRLTGDGHLSAAGHRHLAEALAVFLRDRALL